MYSGVEGVLIGSEDATKLAHFYRDKVGLNLKDEFEMGDGINGFFFEIGGFPLTIIDHSEVKGKAKEPQRVMFNLEVKGEIEEAVKKLDEAGVKKVADTYHVEDYGYIATFEDLDGNYFQLVKTKA